MLKTALAAAVLTLAAAPAPAQQGGDMTPSTVDVVEAASANDNLGKFLEATMAAGLGERLAQADGVTILAPIDPAFDAAGDLPQDREALARLLSHHVIPGVYLARDVPEGETQVRTLAGTRLTVINRGGSISIQTGSGEPAMVVRQDIRADNGVVHAINAVLVP